jgi:phosphoglycerol transferase MdoB-like AlkP superfamily enzyme
MKRFFTQNFKSSIVLLGVFIFIILFLELTFKARVLFFEFKFDEIFNLDILRNILFTLTYGLFVLLFLKLFKPNTVKHLFIVFSSLLVILYFSQDIYFLVSNNFYSFALSGDLAKGLTFFYRLPQSLKWSHLWYLIPIILMVIIIKTEKTKNHKLFHIKYNRITSPFAIAFLAFLSLFISVQTISAQKDPNDIYDFSDYDLYIQPVVPHTAMRKFGVITYARIDLQNAIRGEEDTQEESMHDLVEDYFRDKVGHELNGMTDIFEDKNLIMIMAESLDTYAIDEDLTPNLFALKENAWSFSNFYAPLYYRNTADTEFMVQTSYYPNKNIQLSMLEYMDNDFPNTFPKLFIEEDYAAMAFHNFSDHFYPRELFHPKALGYQAYYNDESLGMITPDDDDREASGHYWHSDQELFEKGLPYLLENPRFFGYFLTVTGHLPYEGDRHDYALKHIDTIETILEEKGLSEIDESLKYYHAAQYEFDLAIGYLIDTLTNEGLLDDTIIVIFGDHYAYGLEQDVIWEYDTDKNPETILNIHNVPLIIYNPELETAEFDNFFSTIDLLPTLSNMFGLNLDYQAIMGDDAFNSVPNTILFSSTSFLTQDFYYEVERDLFEYFTHSEATEIDTRPLVGEIFHRINVSNYILNNDYFSEFYGSKAIIIDLIESEKERERYRLMP